MTVSTRKDAFHKLLGTFKAEICVLVSSLTFVLSLICVLGLVLH